MVPPPCIGVIYWVSSLDVSPGQNGDEVVITEGQSGVLVAGVHHHRCGGENTGDCVPGTTGTQLETIGVKYSAEAL